MAVRAPTTFNKYIDDSALRPLDNVEFTEPEKILDDQEFVLKKNEMLISDCWYPVPINAAARTELGRYYIRAPNMCAYDPAVVTVNCEAAIWAKSSNATNFDVHIFNVTTAIRYTYNVVANQNVWRWRGWFTVVVAADGSEIEIAVEATALNNPPQTIQIAGCALFTNM